MGKRYRRILAFQQIGQALLEFALILPFLTLAILGIFDLGWVIYANNTLANAAREGARMAIIMPKNDTDWTNRQAAIRNHVRESAQGLGLTDSQIDITPFPNLKFGNPVTVTVTYTYTPITPVIGTILAGNGLSLKASSAMILEGIIPY